MTQPPNRYVAGAIDLGEVKARAEARQQAAEGGAANEIAPFFYVTENNLEEDVLRRSIQVPVVLMVGSSKAEGNDEMRDDLRELAESAALSYVVAYVDAAATPAIAQALGVRGVPTVLILAAGRPLTQFEGAQKRESLEAVLGDVIRNVSPQLEGLPPGTVAATADSPGAESTPAEDPRWEQATAALNVGDFTAAAAIYDDMIAENPPEIAELKQARATVAVLERLDPLNRSTDAVAEAEADPTAVDKQLAAADAEVVARTPEKAFDRLLSLMQQLAGEEKTRVKDRLLELFGLFEVSDPRVLEARSRLASVLY